MDTKEQILKVFEQTGKPLKTGEIAQMINVESKEVGKYIKKLKAEGKIYSPKRCYYEIKK